MIIFFFGDDSYRLKQKVRALKEKFVSASLGNTNLAVLDGKTISYNEIVRQVLAMPFLSKTRLVILENVLSESNQETQEKLSEMLKKAPRSTVLLLTETKPDKRLSLFKKLLLVDKVQEFALLAEDQLRRWIIREVENRKSKIEPAATTKLIEYVGNDLWRMTNEIDKLTTYNRQPTTENIDLLVHSQIQANIFTLIEATAKGEVKRAFHEFCQLLNQGQNEIYLLTMLVFQYRNLLIVKDALSRHPHLSRFDLSKKTGLKPFVLGKTLPLANHFSFEGLKVCYRRLLHFDTLLKTGKIEASVALTLLIFNLAQARGHDRMAAF